MLHARGERFAREGRDVRNHTGAQHRRAGLDQPGSLARPVFDAKALDLLHAEHHAHCGEAGSSEALCGEMEAEAAPATPRDFDEPVDDAVPSIRRPRTAERRAA